MLALCCFGSVPQMLVEFQLFWDLGVWPVVTFLYWIYTRPLTRHLLHPGGVSSLVLLHCRVLWSLQLQELAERVVQTLPLGTRTCQVGIKSVGCCPGVIVLSWFLRGIHGGDWLSLWFLHSLKTLEHRWYPPDSILHVNCRTGCPFSETQPSMAVVSDHPTRRDDQDSICSTAQHFVPSFAQPASQPTRKAGALTPIKSNRSPVRKPCPKTSRIGPMVCISHTFVRDANLAGSIPNWGQTPLANPQVLAGKLA